MSEQNAEYRARLESIRESCGENNWNSYGALAVTRVPIEAAKRLCESLTVSPTNAGGINITMAAEAVSLELNGDGQVASVYVDVADVAKWVALQDAEQNNCSGVIEFVPGKVVGEIVGLDFEVEPAATIVYVKVPRDARLGHWWVSLVPVDPPEDDCEHPGFYRAKDGRMICMRCSFTDNGNYP